MAAKIPRSWNSLLTFVGIKRSAFTVWVVCPKCPTVYEYEHAMHKTHRGVKSAECQHIRYPNHKQARLWAPCGAKLLKSVLFNGKEVLRPKKVFAVQLPSEALQRFFTRNSFVEKLEENFSSWAVQDEGILRDIYDGKVWKFFQEKDFFSTPLNLSLTMNIDWFRPFKRTAYSVGVIFFVVNNLPREIRFKEENVILAGIIPGPEEPSDLNPFLRPIVEDLIQLWEGKKYFSVHKYGDAICRAAVMCVTSDIPASRKVGGYLSHQAIFGCTRCLKKFPRASFNDKPNYGGYDRETWKNRNNSDHRRSANRVRLAGTEKERSELQRATGARYSELFRLEYYDCVRCLAIDPMHNLLLGTARNLMNVWIEKGIVRKEHFAEFQSRVSELHVPSGLGRLPIFSEASLSSWTADQWKNWTSVYSTLALKGVLPSAHFNCWLLFVEACQILTLRSIRSDQLDRADQCLLEFCKKFEQLYGSECCTPNMHLHLHLKEVFLDFGPAYAFWLYSFERYNGILGDYSTNSRTIESQLMRRFLLSQVVHDSCRESKMQSNEFLKPLKEWFSDAICASEESSIKGYDLSGKVQEHVLEESEEEALKMWYARKNLVDKESVDVSPMAKSARVLLGPQGCRYKVQKSRSLYVLAVRHVGENSRQHRVARVEWFFSNAATIYFGVNDEKRSKETFAKVRWLKEHPRKDFFGGLTIVWQPDFEPSDSSCMVVASDILCQCAHVEKTMNVGYRDFVVVTVSIPKSAEALWWELRQQVVLYF